MENKKELTLAEEEEIREAQRQYRAEYYKKNKKRILEQNRKWNEKNPEKRKEHNRNWWLKKAKEMNG